MADLSGRFQDPVHRTLKPARSVASRRGTPEPCRLSIPPFHHIIHIQPLLWPGTGSLFSSFFQSKSSLYQFHLLIVS